MTRVSFDPNGVFQREEVDDGCTCTMELEDETIVAFDPDCPIHGEVD
jgi:hypothetical protein